jgi:hypothetical protein
MILSVFSDSFSFLDDFPFALIDADILQSQDNMHPWRHLRAGVFIVEQMSLKLEPGQQASYILDIRSVDFSASYSATGGQPPSTFPRRPTAGREGRDAPTALVAQVSYTIIMIRARTTTTTTMTTTTTSMTTTAQPGTPHTNGARTPALYHVCMDACMHACVYI